MNEIQKYKKMLDLKENYLFSGKGFTTTSKKFQNENHSILRVKRCISFPCIFRNDDCYECVVFLKEEEKGCWCGRKERFVKKEEIK